MNIDWSKQHNGVHQAPIDAARALMPDLVELFDSFPDDATKFTWDVKVHMLMPRQYSCIPNWHFDNVPRVGGVQRFDQRRADLPMYLWLSGPPLTEFRDGYVLANVWHKSTQFDEHRGTPSGDFCWRGFVRATHSEIQPPKAGTWQRRHTQVYVSEDYKW